MTADALIQQFPAASERPGSCDHPSVQVPASELVSVATWLRDEAGFTCLLDVTAMDNGEMAAPRFTGLYHFFNLETMAYLRVAAEATGSDDEPHLPSLAPVFPAADWHERETYDMFGIIYDGHPDLRRILMWEGYPYFPLRKEFPLAGHETELPEPDVVAATEGRINPTSAPMMGGPFVASQDHAMSRREPRGRDESWSEAKPKIAKSE